MVWFGLVSVLAVPEARASAGWAAGKFSKTYDFNGQFYIDAGNVYNGVKSVAFWTRGTTYGGKVIDLDGTNYISISAGGVVSTTFATPTIYIDGVIGTTIDSNWHYVVITTGTAINASAVKFGSVEASNLVGMLDDVKMFNYALSAREINEKYRQGSPSMAQGGMINDSSAYAALTITQSGAGKIVDLIGDSITTGTGFALSADGLTTGTGLDISSTSTAGGASGSSKMLNLARSGANTNASHTAYGLYSAVANTGTTSTNVGGYFSASGATNNYGLIVAAGNVGIGVLTPSVPLHVAGQCVTADTKLRRRRKKKKGEKADEEAGEWEDDEYIYDEVMIKDIQPGDQIASMNPITGELVYSQVNGLMNMGIKPLYRLTTLSGRQIRTTENHPYFVRTKYEEDIKVKQNQKLYRFEVDQSIKIEEFNKDTVVAIANKESSFAVVVPKKVKQTLRDGLRKNQTQKFNAVAFALAIAKAVEQTEATVRELAIDIEYSGYEEVIADVIAKIFPHIQVSFIQIGKKSPAHRVAHKIYKKQKTADCIAGIDDFAYNAENAFRWSFLSRSQGGESPDAPQASLINNSINDNKNLVKSKNGQTKNAPRAILYKDRSLAHPDPTRTFSANSINDSGNLVKNGQWVKVKELREKQMIAVVHGDKIVWEKIVEIKQLPAERVYDIEVEGTHNFVANDIIAHNTYINTHSATALRVEQDGVKDDVLVVDTAAGNVGIGTAGPTSILALGGTAARTIQMERNTTAATAGQGLTLSSGGAIAGTADLAGGDLTLKSGISTGTGTSALHFYTATAGITGTADNAPTEKMTILGNGNVGIGTTSPRTRLELGNDGAFLAIGTYNSGWTEPSLGAGTRLLWYPRKAAFRAGYVDSTQWNDANIGTYSFASGYNTLASGYSSIAMGIYTTASGYSSTAMGSLISASGSASTAMGSLTSASGYSSTAMGSLISASGSASTAMGQYLTAGAAANTIVLGQGVSGANRLVNNTASSLMIGFNSTIPTLFVGPSAGAGTTGNVGIGTASPTNILSLGNTAAQKFWIENTATDVVGRALTIAAGGTIAGTAVDNVIGGNLILQSGLGTGTGASTISFQTGTTLTTGKTLQTMSTKMTILGSGNVGIGTTTPGSKLEVLENTSATAQMRLVSDGSNYAEFYVDSTGDLNIDATGSGGDDIRILDQNLRVCAGGSFGSVSCPTTGFTISGNGNLVVENKVIADSFERICPTGYIWVPGAAKFGTMPGFCVMKYEAKGSTGAVVSTSTGLPYVSISQESARAECKGIGTGYHLISENEWMTIAENIANTTINDLDADAGLQLATGHSDNADAGATSNAVASIDAADPIVTGCNLALDMENAANAYTATCEIRGDGSNGVDPGDANDKGFYDTGQDWADGVYVSGGANKAQLRTHILSNGNVIWDFAGNVWEWTDAIISQVDQPGIGNDGGVGTGNWGEWNVSYYLIDSASGSRPPDDGWTATNGIGRLWTYGRDETATTTYRTFLRGGDWSDGAFAGAFALFLFYSPASPSAYIGFRCSR